MTTVANPPYSEFGISEFISRVGAKGYFAKRNRYTVEITPPSGLLSDPNITDTPYPANIQFLIKAVSLPARTSGTSTFRYGGKYGMEVPYEVTPSEGVSITFLETDQWQCRKFWYNWLQYIQNTDSYNMTYYDKFKGGLKISIYNDTQVEAINPMHRIELINVWPKGMSAVELGWENAELLDFTVDLVFKKWEIV